MEEIRIKIHDELPYDIVFDTIRDLLFDEIGEEDTFERWNCSSPELDYKFMVSYRKGKTKLFEVWKTQSKTTE